MNIITDLSGQNLSGYADTLAKNLIARLNRAYPAFYDEASGLSLWRVTVNEPGGVVEVTNLALYGNYGFLMHIAKIDSEGRKVVIAAGELLERYRISRGQRTNTVLADINNAKRDFSGRITPDM
jgi:hypothetical protein